jgi:hypothetical protein
MSNQSRISDEINSAYFTSIKSSEFCVEVLENFDWLWNGASVLEPAAGDGSLLKALRSGRFSTEVTACDLVDYGCGAEIENYLLRPTQKSDVVFTNPPFGKMASLAVKFFNKACFDSDRVAFIVPQSFRKISIIDRLELNFWPIYDSDLPDETYTIPDGSKRVVKTCFQMWERRAKPRIKLNEIDYTRFFKSLTKEQALNEPSAYAIRGQGSKAGKVLNGLDHSEASTRFLVGCRDVIEQLDFSKIASFTAGIPSIGFSELAYAVDLFKKDENKLNDFLSRGAIALLGCRST